MRIRLRGPGGTSTLSLTEDATVGSLKNQISETTQLKLFDLKIGYPPQPLILSSFEDSLPLTSTGLQLDGQQVIVSSREAVKAEPPPPLDTRTTVTSASTSRPAAAKVEDEPPEIPMTNMSGTLVLRVMPDDNSCLFRALSYAILGDVDMMHELRATVAREIRNQPETYTEDVLERPVRQYCDWIQRPNSWGGYVEMSVLSVYYSVEIISINVEDLRIDRFNEGQANRCILVYSGIHYDCIALNPSSPPHRRANADPEFDQRTFPTIDEAPVQGALELCRILQQRNYFVNTTTFQIVCNVCGWRGKGEKDAIKHAETSKHNDFGQS